MRTTYGTFSLSQMSRGKACFDSAMARKGGMNPTKLSSIVEQLSDPQTEREAAFLQKDAVPPSCQAVGYILETIKAVIFPGFFGEDSAVRTRSYFVGVNVDLLHSQLSPDELEQQHITPSTIRLSIGAEHRY